MKTINVDSHNVPATARSKNYQTALATTASSGGGATMPSTVTPTGGAADTAKVAQNLAEDSTDWAKILRKDIDERTENAMSIGKNLTVDGQAILNDVVANTGTFSGMLNAAAATITGALLASTVSATTMNANTFIGELQGNAATATKLKTARTIWGQSFDGSGNVAGDIIGTNFRTSDNNGSPYVGLKYNSDWWYLQVYANEIGIGRSHDKSLKVDNNGNVGIGTSPSSNYKLDVNGNARIASDLYLDATVGTINFASHTTGWRADANGNADFRNIYADELRVQAFTADISQALAGSDYLTKSVSKLSANFVVPAVNSTVRIIVDDIEGMPSTQCFTNGDYIRFRAFNRTSGLTIANVWGTVVLDTTFGTNGFLNGTQAYTFTCTQTTGAGLTVFKGSEVLDYGISESGLIARTTLDDMGSPYEQIATWKNDPSKGNNYTVHARLGNLGGIANCSGYGLYTDNGFLTGKIVIGDLTKTANFLSFDSVNGLQIKLGGTSVATATDVTKAVNGIQIGGRNLFGYNKGIIPDFGTAFGLDKDNNGFWFDASSFDIRLRLSNLGFNGIGGTFTVSGYIKASSATTDCYLNLCDYAPVGNVNVPITTSYIYFERTYENVQNYITPDNYNGFLDFENLTTGVRIYLKDFKIERGNKATTYTPAPEDVDSSISAAQSSAISTAASNAAALYVTQSAYSSQVTILQNSINAKVSQTDFNALGQRVGTAESTITQHSTDIASKVAQTDYTGNTIASLINQTATTIQIQASKINLVGAVTFNSLDSSTQNTINGKKDTIYNYLSGDGITDGVFHAATITINGKYMDRPIKLSVNDRANTPSNVYIGFESSSSLDPSLTMFKKDGTIPFYIVKTATSIWDLYIGQSTGRWSYVYINDFVNNNGGITVTWKNGTVNLPSGYITATQMIGTAEWCYNNDITYINGAHVYTGTLNAISIVANSITSDQINANSVSAAIANVISLDAGRITTGTLSADRIDAVDVVTKGLVAQTIDAQSATISNLNVVNATVSGAITASVIGYNASTVNNGLVNGCLLVGGGNYILPTLPRGKCVEYTLFHPRMTRVINNAHISGQGEYDRFIAADAQSADNQTNGIDLVGYYKIVGIGGMANYGGTLWVYN